MSTRITNALRDAITKNALAKSGYFAQREMYNVRYAKWVNDVRLASLGMPENKLLALEKKAVKAFSLIPENLRADTAAVKRLTSIIVNFSGEREWLYFWDASGKPVRLPSARETVVDRDSSLYVERELLKAEDSRLDEIHSVVSSQVGGALKAFNTVKQLLDTWPEAKELIPEHVPEAKPQLPAVQAADLNKLIGLPSEDLQS